jgi:hypothetical protein
MTVVSIAISLKKKFAKSDPKFGLRGMVLVIPFPGKKVPERRSALRPFEKELPERRPVTRIPVVVSLETWEVCPL